MKSGQVVRLTLKKVDRSQTEEVKDDPISQLQKVALFRPGSARDYVTLSDKRVSFVASDVRLLEATRE